MANSGNVLWSDISGVWGNSMNRVSVNRGRQKNSSLVNSQQDALAVPRTPERPKYDWLVSGGRISPVKRGPAHPNPKSFKKANVKRRALSDTKPGQLATSHKKQQKLIPVWACSQEEDFLAYAQEGLKHGDDPDEAKSTDGKRAIHYAAMYGHHEVIAVLLSAKASMATRDNAGCSALDYLLSAPKPGQQQSGFAAEEDDLSDLGLAFGGDQSGFESPLFGTLNADF